MNVESRLKRLENPPKKKCIEHPSPEVVAEVEREIERIIERDRKFKEEHPEIEQGKAKYMKALSDYNRKRYNHTLTEQDTEPQRADYLPAWYLEKEREEEEKAERVMRDIKRAAEELRKNNMLH